MTFEKRLKNIYVLWYLMKLKKSFDGDPKAIKAEQNRGIHEIMKRAFEVPVYRRKFYESGTTPDDYHSSEDLVKFPTLSKAELRKWMQEEWNEHPEKRGRINILSTSGSSGVPLMMLYSQREQGCSDANWIRALSAAGYRPLFGKMYSFRTVHRDPDDKSRDSFIQKLGLMRREIISEDYCVGDGIADTIRSINQYKPDLICFRRNCLVRIVAYARAHDMPLWKPAFYVPVSETVDEVTYNLLTDALGPGLIDAYGISEMGSCIYKLPGNDFYYVANDIAVANVYDDDDQLADDGRLILTALYKKDYPLINYDVRDLVRSYTKDGLRYFTRIEGRMNDLVRHEKGGDSSAHKLYGMVNGLVGLSQFRFIEESCHDMTIQLVPDPLCASLSREEIEEHFRKCMEKEYGDEFRVSIEWLDVLEPDQTGKQRCFICRVK